MSDLHNMCSFIISKSSLKHVVFVFILYVLISSNMFEICCLNMHADKYNNNTTVDLLKKGMYFIILYILLDLLIELNII